PSISQAPHARRIASSWRLTLALTSLASFIVDETRIAFRHYHMLIQVTNHAPNNPIRTPINGLEIANQKGIVCPNGIALRPTSSVSKIRFIHSAYFESAAAIARVSGLVPEPDCWIAQIVLIAQRAEACCIEHEVFSDERLNTQPASS